MTGHQAARRRFEELVMNPLLTGRNIAETMRNEGFTIREVAYAMVNIDDSFFVDAEGEHTLLVSRTMLNAEDYQQLVDGHNLHTLEKVSWKQP